MDASTRAPGYDLFKLIVAIFLLILAIILMWVSPSQVSTPPPPTGTMLVTPATTLTARAASPTIVAVSPTSPPPAATASPSPAPSALRAPSPTATATVEATPTATTSATACQAAASRSRLRVGTNATILRRLNFRSSPGIRDNWILTNIPGTRVEVIGGPECVPYWTGSYLWWQIQLPDGRTVWSAEGSLQGSFYFMEPNE